MKQARIKCPHCKKSFTVRQVEDNLDKVMKGVWSAVDDMWEQVDKCFKRIFHK